MNDGLEDVSSRQVQFRIQQLLKIKESQRSFIIHGREANQYIIFVLTQEPQFEGLMQLLNDITQPSRCYITTVVRAAKWSTTLL